MEDNSTTPQSKANTIRVSDIHIEWKPKKGTCTFERLPVAMMWVDTTLAGVMSGVQAMVGTERFNLALQSEGRKSVEDDWKVISKFQKFKDGFKAIANIAAVAGWGEWKLVSLDEKNQQCHFRVKNSWEGRYQKALGACWGSGMLAGKMAGYCSKLFRKNCWAEQTAFIAHGDKCDEFIVKPSKRSIEREIENLLATDEATRADMAVAMEKLRKEVDERKRTEEKFRALFEQAGDYAFILSPSAQAGLVIMDANEAACRMHGYARDELIGMSMSKLDPLLRDEDISDRIQRLLSGETMKFETVHYRKDGTSFPLEVCTKAVEIAGQPLLIFSTERDITDRKRTEKEIHKRVKELEEFYDIAIGRELRMKELKEQIEELEKELAKYKKL